MSAARALGGWLPVDMMPSILANASTCFRRSSLSPNTSRSAAAQFFRRAVFLQEFGDDVLADHEIGQYHRVHLDRPAQYPGLHRAGPVGRHHRHPGQCQFQRHGAGFGQRRVRDAELGPLLLLADHDLGLHRPALHRLHDRFLQMRHGRQHQFERHALLLQPRHRLAEHRHVVADFAAPASRQHQQHRRRFCPPRGFVGVRAER